MYVVVPMCCFCDKVQDGEYRGDQHPAWVPLRVYRAKYGLLPEEIWGAHTECPDCGGQYEQFMAHNQQFAAPPSLPA